MPSKSTLIIQSRVEKERSPFAFFTQDLTAANVATHLTEFANLKTSLAAICAGVVRAEKILFDDNLLDASIPTNNFARRETKLLIRYQGDTSGDIFRAELPCPLLSALTMESGDANFVQLADAGVMAAFVADFETIARSPDDPTETVTVLSAQVVGRNI